MHGSFKKFVARRAFHVHSKFRAKKMKNFNFELEEKLDQHFQVKLDGKSNGNSIEAQNPYFDLLIGHN